MDEGRERRFKAFWWVEILMAMVMVRVMDSRMRCFCRGCSFGEGARDVL
jgi:hypothetical protein